MTEQLNTVSSDRYIQTSEIKDNKNKINLNRKGKGVLIGTGALFATGIIMGGANILHEETIATDYENVEENATKTALNSLKDFEKNYGIDPNTVRDVFETANQMGNLVHEGDDYEFSISKNGLDQLSLNVKKVDSDRAGPTNLAHLED